MIEEIEVTEVIEVTEIVETLEIEEGMEEVEVVIEEVEIDTIMITIKIKAVKVIRSKGMASQGKDATKTLYHVE